MSERERAIVAADELAEWCDLFERGTHPTPSVLISAYYTNISIGEFLLWDSESGYADEQGNDDPQPTAKRCIVCYKNLMEQLTAWPKENP